MKYYQNVDEKDRYWIGEPILVSQPAQVNIHRVNKTDDEVVSDLEKTKRKEPYSLPYFHGTLSSCQAKKVLQKEDPGRFLLRFNEENQLRLTRKTFNKIIEHIRLHHEDSFYSVNIDEVPDKFKTIERLVDNMLENNLLSSGIKSNLHRSRNKALIAASRHSIREHSIISL